jgi:PiT family inorganic phosphate transporter
MSVKENSMLISLVVILAFYVAWNLGANDVANAMGTSVGSKAVTLKQALIIAGTLEFTGAVLFGQEVSQTIATKIANPALFTNAPQILLAGMVTVLLACGIWLQIATSRGLPVSSSHAVVGAIAGFSWVALGADAIDWTSIEKITLGWILTPLISGIIAALFYTQIKHWILDQPNQLEQLNEWIPWLSSLLLGIFGIIVLPSLTQPITKYLVQQHNITIPPHDIPLITGAIAATGLTFYSWQKLEKLEKHPRASAPISGSQSPTTNSTEKLFAQFQLLSACFVAFAHGSNDVGNAIAPVAAIAYINSTGNVPTENITIPIWILILGGSGIVTGLAIWGKKVITTIGESITPLQPSNGFCAELATATTILLASRIGLPVSTSHALVGGVVGIGLVQNIKSVQLKTLQGIAAAWIVTVPVSAIVSAAIFAIIRLVNFQF